MAKTIQNQNNIHRQPAGKPAEARPRRSGHQPDMADGRLLAGSGYDDTRKGRVYDPPVVEEQDRIRANRFGQGKALYEEW